MSIPSSISCPVAKPREIRVFLSSTFKDMEFERTHLLKQVFPKVRAACIERGVGFTEIDLRWGVTEEESKNGVTVEICLAEIDRCRDFPPFFIGFLGERYGWIPKEDELAAYWHHHQDSAYANTIRQAIKRGISVTELEMELAVLESGASSKLQEHALFLLRAPDLTDQLYSQYSGKSTDPTDTAYYDQGHGRLDTLKQRIRNSGFLGSDNYTSIEQFGQVIEDYLLGELDKHFPKDQQPSALQRMQQAHEHFRFNRLQNYIARDDVIQTVREALHARQATPALGALLLGGPSGQGKSSIMADLAGKLQGEQGDSHWAVISHFIGADEYTTLDAWIERILLTVQPEIADLVDALPKSSKDRISALPTWLAYAARRREKTLGKSVRFVLLLDAVDQLSDAEQAREFLQPGVMGPDALIVVSAADDTIASQTLSHLHSIAVPPFAPTLRQQYIQQTLQRFRKGLAPTLTERLAGAQQSSSPLFLMLALEQLRLNARHENLSDQVDAILVSPDASHLFLNRFLLDAAYGRPGQPDLACRFMAFLSAGRLGLSENEFADFLALPTDPIAPDTGRPRLPRLELSRLLGTFSPFLIDKQGNRAPMHRIFAEASLRHLGEVSIRQQVYDRFCPGYGLEGQSFDVRGASEALFQASRMAETDPAQRERLEHDISALMIPARLHDQVEDVVRGALNQFSFEGQTDLAEEWAAQVEGKVKADIEANGAGIGNFAGWLCTFLGHYEAAKAIQVPLLKIFTEVLGAEHPETLGAMNNLAKSLFDLSDLQAAKSMFQKVLETRERILGAEHPDTLSAMNNLACSLSGLGDLQAAKALNQKVLEASERILGAEHLDTLSAMHNLAISLSDLGDLQAAKALNQKVLEARERILGAEHPDTLGAMINLAKSLYWLGEWQSAKTLGQKVLDARERILGAEHPDTLRAIIVLATSLGDLGDLQAAKAMGQKVLDASERILGSEQLDTLYAMHNLANSLSDLGDLQAAKALRQKVLAASERILGAEHPDTLTAMSSLASSLSDLGELQVAKALRKEVLEARERILGAEHPNTLRAMSNLAALFAKLGDLQAAKAMFQKVLETRERILGAEHPDTTNARDNLGVINSRIQSQQHNLAVSGISAVDKAIRPFCTKCGNKNRSGIQFCVNCGTPLSRT